MAADPERAPSGWRIAAAILLLPFMATVVVPAAIVARGPSEWNLGTIPALLCGLAGIVLIAVGLGLFRATVRLFARLGRGTLAPWDPPRRLVVAGPYRHLRHPMIFGVALVLAGETLAIQVNGLAIWLGAFVAVNAIYLPLVEEPRLVRRFGPEYERYMQHVPRWRPRLRPWGQ